MSLMQITIEVKGAAAATAKTRRDALRDSFRYLAGLWDKLYKMLRFKDSATARYDLTPRMGEPGSGRRYKGSYTARKANRRTNGAGVRAIGETKPFVWSGASRSKVQATQKIVARATSASRAYAENIFDVPTLNLTPKGGRIKLREEFQRVTERERANLEGLGLLRYERAIEDAAPRVWKFS